MVKSNHILHLFFRGYYKIRQLLKNRYFQTNKRRARRWRFRLVHFVAVNIFKSTRVGKSIQGQSMHVYVWTGGILFCHSIVLIELWKVAALKQDLKRPDNCNKKRWSATVLTVQKHAKSQIPSNGCKQHEVISQSSESWVDIK